MKAFYLIIGFLCAGLGAVGVFLPVLPTTPFLLVASVCFARSSKRFDRWFRATSLYQKHLANFMQAKGMTARAKAVLLGSVTLILFCAFLMTPVLWGKALILMVCLAKYWYLLCRVKTIPAAERLREESSEEETE